MEVIGVIGIIAALVFFIWASMRGWSVMISAPITAIIIILTNQLDLAQYFISDPKSSYLAGLGSFVTKNFLIFLLSAILGKFLDASGAARSIAQALMSKVGKNPFWVLVGTAAVAALLT